jgi:hypothetical protein
MPEVTGERIRDAAEQLGVTSETRNDGRIAAGSYTAPNRHAYVCFD